MAKNRDWTALILLLAVLSNGCRESPQWVKEGALFAPEKTSPGKALVYVYWPREEQGRRTHLWVGSCEGGSEEILPGGYIALAMEPGPSCFKAEAKSDLMGGGPVEGGRVSAFVIQDLGGVELNAEPGQTLFIRLEQKRFPLISRINPRPVEPAVAGPEIRKCRRSVPLTPDELARQFLQESESLRETE
jgi:hypothetical protein